MRKHCVPRLDGAGGIMDGEIFGQIYPKNSVICMGVSARDTLSSIHGGLRATGARSNLVGRRRPRMEKQTADVKKPPKGGLAVT